MLKPRSTRRVTISKLQSRPHSSHMSSSSPPLTSLACIKQSLMIGFGAWFMICIIYYLFVIITSKPNNASKPTIHPTLKSKYNTMIDNSYRTTQKQSKPDTPQPNGIKNPLTFEYKYGHPTKRDMENPCIVILTYNRPNQLLRTVNSLLSIEGVTSYKIYISQDGYMQSATNMIQNTIGAIPYKQPANHSKDRTVIKHIVHTQANYVRDPTAKLAIHYKFMFDIIFNELQHSHAIILEDDMVFSADFLEYFAATVHLLNDAGNDLFCISSWNDYGQTFLDHDQKALFRSDYFPGLGWLLKRALWEEIQHIFPDDHWDHFMRMDIVTKERDCIYPDISRNYNIGEIGSTMDGEWYNKYLRPMQFDETLRIEFGELDLSYLEKRNYEKYMIDMFENKAKFVGIFPRDRQLIYQQINTPNINKYGSCLLIAYYGYNWQQIANRIGVVETQRTKHKNTIVIKKNNVRYIFANIRLSPYLTYNMEGSGIINSMSLKNENMVVVTGETGKSCDEVCRNNNNNMQCLNDHFEYINYCSVLSKYFKCEAGCLGGQIGEDVPNYVSRNKPGLYQKCLTTEFQPSCKALHHTTSRICPCA